MASDKIRVVIVDDVAETRENVRKLLQFESDVEVAGTAGSGKEGVKVALELDPDVILMDINMPDMDGITATEMIRQKLPHVQVIILSVQNDQNYMRRAMLAGARDFLTKPPMGDELISAVRRAGEMARMERAKGAQQKMVAATAGAPAMMQSFAPAAKGKIIMVYSPKGGTGCTTTAVNLALALHSDDTRTVLVDANLQFGDIAIFVNVQSKNTITELAPRVDELDPELLESILVKHETSGLRVLAAPSTPEMAEQVSAEQFIKVVQYLQRVYAYVVIDTSSILTELILSVIDVSDLLVLITTQEIPAIKSSRLIFDLLNTMRIGKERILFVMNRYDKEKRITPERVSENLKCEISTVIPFDDKTVTNSINRGIPFMIDNKSLPVGRGILSLAESVRARLTSLETEDNVPIRR
jgi:pilus assembly protein CpaE